MPTIQGVIIPTGGAIQLTLTTAISGNVTLARAVSGATGLGTFTTLYSGTPYVSQLDSSGNPIPTLYLDTGDQLPSPLLPGTLYVYSLTDANGTAQTPPFNPAVSINLQPEPLTQIMIRLLQAGINSLVPSSFNSNGGKIPQVLHDMPLAGFPAMPFVTVNCDLVQQEEIPIGQNVQQPDKSGNWTIGGFAKFVYRISVFANNSPERDFYRDAVIGIFNAILQSVFVPLGKNIRHRYQAANGQVAQDNTLQIPGFYYSDVMLEFEGVMNIVVTATYGLIAEIIFTGTTPSGDQIVVEVPLSS